MKRFTTVILTALSAFALSFSVSSHADNTDSDGFIVFESTQAVSAEAPASNAVAATAQQTVQAKPAKKQVAKKARKVRKPKNKARAKRADRKKRITRTQRKKRSHRSKQASSYVVRRGDTLYRISVKFGVKLSSLARLNKLRGSNKHNIQAGQTLRLR